MKAWIERRYGTWRGLVRAVLGLLELAPDACASSGCAAPKPSSALCLFVWALSAAAPTVTMSPSNMA
jgi:hypothetical protein